MTNKRIWDKFEITDKKFTKPFKKFGSTLTTIDPMYQIMKMTDTFGPVGQGWTYEAKYTYTDKNVFSEIKIGWKEEANKEFNWYGPISSVNPLYKSNNSLDDEAPKKATTDALTKAMSHLGMSADVFLGKFDGDKYSEEKDNNKNNNKNNTEQENDI